MNPGKAQRGIVVGVSLLGSMLALWPRPALASSPMTDETFYEIVLLLSVVSVGYIVTHLVVERLSKRFAFVGGIEYVALGVVLGPVLQIISPEIAHDIRPVLLLGTGALGMLAGLELGPLPDSTAKRGSWIAALLVTISTAVVVIVAPLLLLWALGYDLEADAAWTAAILAAGIVALGADGEAITKVATSIGASGKAIDFGNAVATRVRALATIGFAILYAVVENNELLTLRSALDTLQMFGVQLGAGVLVGLLFGVVIHRKLDERTLLAVVIGMTLLAGGFAYAIGVSSIFVNFVAGLTFTRTSPYSSDATRTMRSIKQPLVIALYFFAGLEWVTGALWLYLLIVPFVALRQLGRSFGGWLGGRFTHWPTNVGAAAFAPGGLALAFLLSIRLIFPDVPGVLDVYGPLVTTLLALEIGSLRAVRRWLVDVTGLSPTRSLTPPATSPPPAH